ncbi:MAG: O-antigen ligase family protein, partial [Alphaproteobacteria bacterium]|nr:O-antigen ligase family protein [Alphaproteobacteria bacterium]
LGFGLVLVVLLGGILAAEPDLFRRHVGQTSNTLANFEQSPYGLIWRNALKVTAEHPVFGLGMRNFRYACTCTEYTACGPQDVFCALHPHNTYLEWMAETGVPGLAGFLLLIGLWFVRLLRARRENLLSSSAVGGWIAVGLGLWPFASTGSFFSNWNAVMFWLVLGTALAATELARCAKQAEGH